MSDPDDSPITATTAVLGALPPPGQTEHQRCKAKKKKEKKKGTCRAARQSRAGQGKTGQGMGRAGLCHWHILEKSSQPDEERRRGKAARQFLL